MAVTFDAKGNANTGNSVTTNTSLVASPITIAASSSIAVGLAFGGTAGLPTSITVTYDTGSGGSNQAMTAITGATGNDTALGGTSSIIWYFLQTPTRTGNQQISASWTGGRSCSMYAISATGVGSVAHGTANSANAATNSLAITSATGNLVAGMWNDDGTAFTSTITNGTQDYLDSTTAGDSNMGGHAAGASTVTLTGNLTISDISNAAGFDFVAAAGGDTLLGQDQKLIQI